MRNKKRKIFSALLFALCLAIVFSSQSFAADVVHPERNCTLTINYTDSGKPVGGVPFKIYRVADIKADGSYELSGDFKKYPVELNGLTSSQWRDTAETLTAYAKRDKLTAYDYGKTGSNGLLKFPNHRNTLKAGLYLVVGETHTTNGYTYFTEPFLVSLPSKADNNDSWDYNVTAEPKHNREDNPPPNPGDRIKIKVIKVWKDNESIERPSEITIQLLKNGEIYETIKLNASNNWRYDWGSLPKYDENGKPIEWRVAEVKVDGYTVIVSKEGFTFVITNTSKPEKPTKPGTTKPDSPTNPSEKTTKPNVPGKTTVPNDNNNPTKPSKQDKPKLPQTGALWWPVPAAAICGIAFIAVGVGMKKKKKYE